MKILVVKPGLGFQAIQDFSLCHLLHQTVTNHATGPETDLPVQVIALQDFEQLAVNLIAANQVTVHNFAVFEDAEITSKNDAVFTFGDVHNFSVIKVVAVTDIETEQ